MEVTWHPNLLGFFLLYQCEGLACVLAVGVGHTFVGGDHSFVEGVHAVVHVAYPGAELAMVVLAFVGDLAVVEVACPVEDRDETFVEEIVVEELEMGVTQGK
jgi:hypothetical protein